MEETVRLEAVIQVYVSQLATVTHQLVQEQVQRRELEEQLARVAQKDAAQRNTSE